MPLNGYGFLIGTVTSYRPQRGGSPRVTVSKPAKAAKSTPPLRFEYQGVEQTHGRPADVCVIDLSTNKLV